MFEAWGRIVYRVRWIILALGLAAITAAGVWGTGVFRSLQTEGAFTAPGSQSQQAADLAARSLGRDTADVVVLYRSATATVDEAAYRRAVTATLAALPASKVASEQTYWSTGAAQMVSADRHATYAVLQLTGADDNARRQRFDAIKNRLGAPGLRTIAGGIIPSQEVINEQVSSDIGKAETFSLPALLVMLTVIFGSLAAASLPLAIGGTAILGSFTALRLLTLVTSVSIYAVNITTILGLGLAIDYGLFIVGRFREETHAQPTVADALARTLATAGRTVAVSGITVALALSSLLLFPGQFLRSMGYGGVATVLVDMGAALTVLPALLAVLGPKVNALRVRRAVRRPPRAEGTGAWYRIAASVMRRPVAYVVVIVAALLALGAPFLSIKWGGTDVRVLPASAPVRQVDQALSHDFTAHSTGPIEAVVALPGPVAAHAQQAALAGYITRLDAVPGVTVARLTGAAGRVARVDLGYAPDPMSTQARHIVALVRAVPPPPGARAYVGGETAHLVDNLASLGHTLPWMALAVAGATFVLLFLAFGSIVLPVKAIVMNVVSLSATAGAIVWIFQDGHLSGLLRFTPTGTIDPTMPILMLAIVFGLSMDYEVFLLSRIRERYDLTGDNATAVAGGLQRTGGIITSAALLLIVVIGAISTSGISFIKLLGVGMIIALVVDASIVRVLLVPATMRLLGRANWWAPAAARRLYARYGIREAEPGLARPGPSKPATA